MAGRRPKYSEKDVRKFLSLIEGGMQRKKAAESLGTDTKTIGQAAERLGIEIPKRIPAIELVKPYEAQILEGTITQWQIARATGLSQCRVSHLYREQGWPALPIGKRGRNPRFPREVKEEQAEELIAYLMENGGYVLPSIRKLGLQIDKCFFYSYCKQHGFDYRPYRWAGRRYGYWLTLPCTPPRTSKSDYLIDAECTLCGSVHKVSLINMKVGNSLMCRSCAAERKEFSSVVCVETGKKYRSILNASKQLGIPYQSFRKSLVVDGEAKVEGKTYRTTRKVYTRDIAV